ncbi:hypothetical protein HELRODRAFT_163366 [Helobdella robusta]|uniref:SUEL-type lectin domain-containing protein n=1 Tax=Helobdella robusta TaxID=6412 RepID=T1ETY5_HELRO|nr:hypothetical protein HELRODRAFT_163366 [Helobdella robusta]ESN96315.1 hypothetical protein HELRODRAFT_163366 [Helobdella robusta]
MELNYTNATACWFSNDALYGEMTCQDDVHNGGKAAINILLTSQEEYCHYETFKATCPLGHVILMTSSYYGRKNLGKCVRTNFGFIGCHSNVLSIMDRKCSARDSCTLQVIEPSFDNIKPCNAELKSYLEVEYTCIRVMKINEDEARMASRAVKRKSATVVMIEGMEGKAWRKLLNMLTASDDTDNDQNDDNDNNADVVGDEVAFGCRDINNAADDTPFIN